MDGINAELIANPPLFLTLLEVFMRFYILGICLIVCALAGCDYFQVEVSSDGGHKSDSAVIGVQEQRIPVPSGGEVIITTMGVGITATEVAPSVKASVEADSETDASVVKDDSAPISDKLAPTKPLQPTVPRNRERSK